MPPPVTPLLVPFQDASAPLAKALVDVCALYPDDQLLQSYVGQAAAFNPQYADLLGLLLLALDRSIVLNQASIQTYTLPVGILAYVVNGVLVIVGSGAGPAANLEIPGFLLVDGVTTTSGQLNVNGAMFASGIPNEPPTNGDLVIMRTADGHLRAVSLNALPTVVSSDPGAYSGSCSFNASEAGGGSNVAFGSPINNVFSGIAGTGLSVTLADSTRIFLRTQILGSNTITGTSQTDTYCRFQATVFSDGVLISNTPYDLPNATLSTLIIEESFVLPAGTHVLTLKVALNRASTDGSTHTYTVKSASFYLKS
jgi:hypothetical protein